MSNENNGTTTGYTTYQGMVSQVSASLTELEKVCKKLKLEKSREDLQKSRDRLASHKFSVGVMGEFKRGKSTVINSMLEKEIMPSDILPCSATMNRVTYDLQPHVEMKMVDGSVKEISVDDLVHYVTKLNSENESRAAEVKEAVVYYPCKFCQNGVDIVDTPGLNDDERMNKICEEVIPKLDAVIMVITPDNPFSMSEAEFVRSKLMASDLSRLIFLVNKIDTIRRAEDRERVVADIKQRIQDSVLEKMAELYGEGSREYQDAKLKLGSIRIYPISALDALDGKVGGDKKLLEQSGTIPFEEALTHMLTEERGALELGMPLNVIQRVSVEATKSAMTRKDALELNGEEFEKRQREALAKIQEMREKKKGEAKRLSSRSVEIKGQLERQVMDFYPELEKKLKQVVDGVSIDPKELSGNAGQENAAERLKKAVSDEMQSSMAMMTEKIQVQLEEIIGKEVVRLGQFMEKVSSQIDALQVNLNPNKGSFDKSELAAFVGDTLLGGLGIGGMVSGYKNAGVKGALAGGGISWVATFSMAFLLASMSVVGLPLAVISCAVGNSAGKFFTGKLFSADIGQRRLEELRSGIKGQIHRMVAEMQGRRELENWVQELIDGRFQELTDNMEAECERMLQETESTMDSIKEGLKENEIQRRHLEKECDTAISMIQRINEQLKPLNEKIRQVLESA